MDVPIEKKRKIGASTKNLSCYNKQPSDVVQLDEGVIVENDETFDDTSRPNKRAKTVEVEANSENANVICKKCNEPMKKKKKGVVDSLNRDKYHFRGKSMHIFDKYIIEKEKTRVELKL
ncbi:hypothetical protein BpHYR1_014030 [Brachionus plicatilis]|uniref:Uncharacterized protein n=1 Tax=Brachionus plicatilis TaxID=10195 RepID=A0A3M7QR80_BRAPC|nr:hypothetical protein BpHYR1_014030 [Brachionus plicatilis]